MLEGQWRAVRANRPALCEYSEYPCECSEYTLSVLTQPIESARLPTLSAESTLSECREYPQ